MDINILATQIGVVVLILGGIFFLLTTPWSTRWKCSRCQREFASEEEAKGHQAVHGEHKAIQESD